MAGKQRMSRRGEEECLDLDSRATENEVMKKLVGFLFVINMLFVPLVVQAANPGEGKWVAEEVFRSANTGGMTGLIHMNSAYTVRDGEMQINVGLTTESVGGTRYLQAPIAITYGLSDNKELGLVGRYISASTGTAGLGGAELKLKWRFRKQTEYLPATSLAFGLIIPTGPAALNEVSSWGARLNFLAASEASITETGYIGMYLEIGAVAIDPGSAGADSYVDASIGLLFPISDDNHLQLILELNAISGRGIAYLGSTNYTAVTPGLRYASENFKMTMGAETRSNGSTKIVSTLGFEF